MAFILKRGPTSGVSFDFPQDFWQISWQHVFKNIFFKKERVDENRVCNVVYWGSAELSL